jgi:hypothetical protein
MACPAPFAKIFCFAPDPNHFHNSRRPVPQRGVAHVTNAGRDAVDAAASGEQWRAGRMMLKRTAKSCGSDAPGLASSLREEAQATMTTKPGHRGEHEISRKTIARGMPGDFRCDRGDYARVLFYFAREAAGALSARHSLRPLLSRGECFLQNSGTSRRGIADAHLEVAWERGWFGCVASIE